jgi:DNA-binding MarR family transcriptional regulator
MTEQSASETSPFVEQMGQLWEGEGLPLIAGRIFGFLLLQDEPCCLDDLAAHLGVSKASVSTDARRLERLGLLERSHLPTAARRDFYAIAPDASTRVLSIKLEQLHRFGAAMDDLRGMSELPPVVHNRIEQFGRNHHLFVATLRQLLADLTGNPPSPSASQQNAITTHQ